jgi:adenosylhomocysteine nucleosidase
MATASVLIAAEERELKGLLKRLPHQPLAWPDAAFARVSGSRILLANGAGPRSVEQMFENMSPDEGFNIQLMVSVGFCGALDPALKVGDIVVWGGPVETKLPYVQGEIWSEDRVIVTADQKRQLRERTGATVVEMEFAAVQNKAREWGVPCRAVRVVSDTAGENLPLDFNRYRDGDGRFQVGRIALAGLLRPFTVLPELMRLDRQSRLAAENLGAFLADCKF